MQALKYLDTPLSWAVVGFVIGIAVGVNALGVWLVTAGLVGFLVYLRLHSDAKNETEGRLFAAGPVFLVAWIVGFVVRGLIF